MWRRLGGSMRQMRHGWRLVGVVVGLVVVPFESMNVVVTWDVGLVGLVRRWDSLAEVANCIVVVTCCW